MTVDSKVKEYLDRAIEILEENEKEKGTTYGFTFRYENSCVIQIASLLQKEEYNTAKRKKREVVNSKLFDYEKKVFLLSDEEMCRLVEDLKVYCKKNGIERNVDKELNKMRQWFVDNPSKSRRKSNLLSFAKNWLDRE